MASRNQISINFTATKQRASELEDIADRLEKLAQRDAQNILAVLAGNWKGENSTLYLQKGSESQEDIGKTAASIRKLASTIRQIGQNIYNAEMEALRIAEERKAQAEAKFQELAKPRTDERDRVMWEEHLIAEVKAQEEAEAQAEVAARVVEAAVREIFSRKNK